MTRKVLLVDDDAAVREALAQTLELAEYHPVTAGSFVAAKDLINGSTISVDVNVPAVTYVHLLLNDHQVLWANGVESESFHPASAGLEHLGDDERARLFAQVPQIERDVTSYGAYARRVVSSTEAAILRHDAA